MHRSDLFITHLVVFGIVRGYCALETFGVAKNILSLNLHDHMIAVNLEINFQQQIIVYNL